MEETEMKISYNAAAMRASNALNASDSKVSLSLRRLSSGLKVTASKDNPSGYAIGRRMNTQIVGLDTARQSSQNGISVIETADGALTEVHEMLQRMNELAVKGETGTLTTSDRMMIDQEVKGLKAEITRISTDTQFNGQTLLDGTFDLRGYSKNNNQVRVDYYSDEVIPKEYMIDALTVDFDAEGKIDENSVKIALRSSGAYAFPAGVEVSEVKDCKITLKGPLDFKMTLEVEKPATLPGTVDLMQSAPNATNVTVPTFNAVYTATGTPPVPVLDLAATQNNFATAIQGSTTIPQDATVSSVIKDDATGADTLIITNDSGFRLELPALNRPTLPAGTAPGTAVNAAVPGATVQQTIGLALDITGIGAMDTQTGANEGQQLAIRIPTISLNRMGLENTRMTTSEECAEANKSIKGAILYVSDARSRLGAYQNRLEHTINNLDVSKENMTGSYSRIMDVDMAEEMTNYTTEQVISQAAVSMLAQANERPSQVLQLLQ